MSALRITSAAQLRSYDLDQRVIIPAHLNPAIPLRLRLPAFESMAQVRFINGRIASGITTWSEYAAAITHFKAKHH